ncbi:hypothetical protein ABZY02_02640 [Streptomyces sp. NPDC006649]|uniref:hypothetical protein n=1 Tax=Streptomyces sp. NPDC006649 TaxID=3156896 RepID=UPI0033B828B5
MRIEVRLLLWEFGADERARAYRWLDHGQWEALYRLRAGEPYAFTAAGVVWAARPVLFLTCPAAARPASAGLSAVCGPGGYAYTEDK